MLDRIAGAASVVSLAVGALVGPGGPSHSVDFTFRDPAIVESSGLVVRDGLFVTVNDSGDSGRVFVVDGSGRTVGTTTWAEEPTDVEALAPAGPGWVWVGDLGDNAGSRDDVEVLRVPYGRGDREVEPASYRLVYPDGPHDAETLLADPRTGRLLVVSKDVFGGTVYAAPRQLSAVRPNRLTAVADGAPGLATDGAFFPDGRHYVVRDYGGATVYAYPGHERVGSFRLPGQRQGEGIAVAEDGTVHISTEGQFSDVLQVDLPRALERALRPPARSHDGAPPQETIPTQQGDPVWPWVLGGGVLVVAFVAAVARLLTRHGSAA
jgi:hypothetical protein